MPVTWLSAFQPVPAVGRGLVSAGPSSKRVAVLAAIFLDYRFSNCKSIKAHTLESPRAIFLFLGGREIDLGGGSQGSFGIF